MADSTPPEELMQSMEALLESRKRLQALALTLREAIDGLYEQFPDMTQEDFEKIAKHVRAQDLLDKEADADAADSERGE